MLIAAPARMHFRNNEEIKCTKLLGGLLLNRLTPRLQIEADAVASSLCGAGAHL